MNTRFKVHIDAKGDEQLKKELIELASIVTGLRQTTKKWQDQYGSHNREDMRKWEKKADEWIDKHKIIIQDKTTENEV